MIKRLTIMTRRPGTIVTFIVDEREIKSSPM